MKKTILALAILLLTLTTFAQDNNEKSFRVPSGYQGFLELGSARGLAYNLSRVNAQLSTTHGYQFNDKVFAGLGAGYNISFNHQPVIPFYGSFRYIFTTDKQISPILRTRVGAYYDYYYPELKGFGAYGDLGFGVRLATKSCFAFNLMVVATYYSDLTVKHYHSNFMGMGGQYGYYENTRENISNISLAFSLEW